MSISSRYKRYLRVIDNVVDEVAEELAEKGKEYSCRKGCSHCCHMYVETTWNESMALAKWIRAQEQEFQAKFLPRVEAAATERAEFFRRRPQTQRYATPTTHHKDLPDEYNREYFYSSSRPCPLLEDDVCTAYEARPSACRLHVVISDPVFCNRETPDDSEMTIPDEFDRKRERIEAIAEEYLPDSRWGELSIMLQHCLERIEKNEAIERDRAVGE